MRYLTVEEVLALHSRIIASSGGSLGVREPNALDSAVAQPQMTFGGVDLYATVARKAAALGHSLISNHPFVDGNNDLGQMLMAALDVRPVANAVEASARYGGTELRAAEQARAERRRAVVRELQKRFVDGPVLLVPSGGSGTFNAVGATPIPGAGTVYFSQYRQKGVWGTLEATNGVLISDDGRRWLPGPVRIEGANITGDGWTVTVAPGWTVRPGPRSGDYQIIRTPQ